MTNNQNLKTSIIYDLFTGLYTKSYFEQTAKNILSENKDRGYALVIADIDGLNRINKSCGRKTGDRIILDISKHLLKFPYPTSRSDDKFLLLIPCPSTYTELEALIYQIFSIKFSETSAEFSFGKSLFPQQGTSYGKLFEEATRSLLEAKQNKKHTSD